MNVFDGSFQIRSDVEAQDSEDKRRKDIGAGLYLLTA